MRVTAKVDFNCNLGKDFYFLRTLLSASLPEGQVNRGALSERLPTISVYSYKIMSAFPPLFPRYLALIEFL